MFSKKEAFYKKYLENQKTQNLKHNLFVCKIIVGTNEIERLLSFLLKLVNVLKVINGLGKSASFENKGSDTLLETILDVSFIFL